jgi:hypothetical protein
MNNLAAGIAAPSGIDLPARLQALARATAGSAPVVSVYLDTRWSDEHQRDRVRIFLKNEIRQAAAMSAGQLEADLAWIAAEGERLVAHEVHPEIAGVAMFAGGPGRLREMLPVAVAFTDIFTVASLPRLRPLVTALGEAPRAVVLFVDSESARLVSLTEQGPGDEITLEAADALGQHRRGGWLLLLQSRYQRHIHVHRARHFDAVAAVLTDVVDHHGLGAIVLAGEPRNVSVFRTHVPARLSARIAGEVAAARYEPSSTLAERALAVIRLGRAGTLAAAVDTVLAEAEGGGRATAGVEATIEAANRGAVDRLYLLQGYAEDGRACVACRALQRAGGAACRWCAGATGAIEVGEGLVQRVLAASGDVASLQTHAGLARAGGVAALLRYPPR